jgi:nicotinate-nucleotide adenylyltransferase
LSGGRQTRDCVGVFGGTFNPVHYGHLRSALELVERLGLDQLRLMPCSEPPHRTVPCCPAEHRAAMVELAVAGEPALLCDRRELERPGASYTITSLEEMRQELGDDCSLCLVMGGDALAHVDTWHRWRELLDLAHIVAIARPGWDLPVEGEVASWLHAHQLAERDDLRRQGRGGVLLETLRPLAISSTEIREMLAAGRSARYLVPEPVLDYIHAHGLYLG